MIRGVDTTFLVQVDVLEHPQHAAACSLLDRLLAADDSLAIAPQVLAELVHVVSDPRRFARPLSMARAMARAEFWWSAKEVTHALPDERSVRIFVQWMTEHQLGRKRLLDTLLAATYHASGLRSIVTTNARDFAVFGCFEVLEP